MRPERKPSLKRLPDQICLADAPTAIYGNKLGLIRLRIFQQTRFLCNSAYHKTSFPFKILTKLYHTGMDLVKMMRGKSR